MGAGLQAGRHLIAGWQTLCCLNSAILTAFRPKTPQASKGLWNARLLQCYVGPNGRFDLVVDHKPATANRALPNFVIALALSDESAAVLSKNGFDTRRVIFCHQAATFAYSDRSASILNSNLSASNGTPFSASNSGMATLSFSMSSSSVSAPVARP